MAAVPAVVSREQFDLVKGEPSENESFARRDNKTHDHLLLRALVSCGARKPCSSVARTRTGKEDVERKRRYYYVCSGKFDQSRGYPEEEECPSRYDAPADRLDEPVWKDLCGVPTGVPTHPESIADATTTRRAHHGGVGGYRKS